MNNSERPDIVAIDPDDYLARHVDRTSDSRQFFLTTPFVPAAGGEGREFLALYLFDADGRLLETQIDDLGTRAGLDEEGARLASERRLAALGEVERCRIDVRPFEVERFGTTFGLVLCPPEDDEEGWTVEAQPDNYMAFFEPWDSGGYDT